MEAITVPELYCPFPPRVNRHVEAVRGASLDWVRRFRLASGEADYRRIRAANCSGLAARCHPEAPLEGLQIVSDLYALMFVQDDLRDESEFGEHPGQLVSADSRCVDILEGREPGQE